MMENDTTYNGWTNKQTWNINLLHCEIFTDLCQDEGVHQDLEDLAMDFESTVSAMEFEGLEEGTLAHQTVGEYLNEVNWTEIAEHYAADFDLFKDEEEVEHLNNCDQITE
jgi:hypothetical protein